jgi:hypothetical protein
MGGEQHILSARGSQWQAFNTEGETWRNPPEGGRRDERGRWLLATTEPFGTIRNWFKRIRCWRNWLASRFPQCGPRSIGNSQVSRIGCQPVALQPHSCRASQQRRVSADHARTALNERQRLLGLRTDDCNPDRRCGVNCACQRGARLRRSVDESWRRIPAPERARDADDCGVDEVVEVRRPVRPRRSIRRAAAVSRFKIGMSLGMPSDDHTKTRRRARRHFAPDEGPGGASMSRHRLCRGPKWTARIVGVPNTSHTLG